MTKNNLKKRHLIRNMKKKKGFQFIYSKKIVDDLIFIIKNKIKNDNLI